MNTQPGSDPDFAPDGESLNIPAGDKLDALLRAWHAQNVESAKASRDALLAKLGAEVASADRSVAGRIGARADAPGADRSSADAPFILPSRPRGASWRISALAAAVVLFFTFLAVFFQPGGVGRSIFGRGPAGLIGATAGTPAFPPPGAPGARVLNVAYCPEGGRLEAHHPRGGILGVCPLKHTDVKVDVSGFAARVTVRQQYSNPYADKIEAVYTFPLSHNAAVDHMTMVIGDRVIVGEVKERRLARRMYEAARAQNRVAGLLEQERPNIFTQSIANIEPGARIDIEISYVEMLDQKNGEYTITFPMTVGPRYIPGYSLGDSRAPAPGLPEPLRPRAGLVPLGPGTYVVTETRNGDPIAPEDLRAAVESSVPIESPVATMDELGIRMNQHITSVFTVEYADGVKETGVLFDDNTGALNNRWFWCGPRPSRAGTGYAPDTDRVPDASRITPMPVDPRIPGNRAGHDISITVTIDTGGPGITAVESRLHPIIRHDGMIREDGSPSRTTITLAARDEIPNKDFVLTWRQTSDTIRHAAFTHSGPKGDFFTLMVQPPKRVDDAMAIPKELVFVLDTSGSMQGFPIEKAKEVMTKAMAELRPQDTFNVITFSGDTAVLWNEPRPGIAENIAAARDFIAARRSGGGTEMMKAIHTALSRTSDGAPSPRILTPADLLNLPADGRRVEMRIDAFRDAPGIAGSGEPFFIERPDTAPVPFADWLHRYLMSARIGPEFWDNTICGTWETRDGKRVLVFESWSSLAARPLRIVCFMTDGYVGNDMEIIDAIKRNAESTRVFSFGIGNSVNRYLLDNMARAGRGEAEYVLLTENADDKVRAFAERIRTPVLADVQVEFSPNVTVTDVVSPGMIGPPEWRPAFGEPMPDPAVVAVDPAGAAGSPRAAARPMEGGRGAFVLPDLFDVKPIVLHGRFVRPVAGRPSNSGGAPVGNDAKGWAIVRGRTASGPFEQRVELDLTGRAGPDLQSRGPAPSRSPDDAAIPPAPARMLGAAWDADEWSYGMHNQVIATLWARCKVEQLMNEDLAGAQQGGVRPDLRSEIIALSEEFNLLTQYTSFVAIDKARITINGVPRLVTVPIELPSGVSWEGNFGGGIEADTLLPAAVRDVQSSAGTFRVQGAPQSGFDGRAGVRGGYVAEFHGDVDSTPQVFTGSADTAVLSGVAPGQPGGSGGGGGAPASAPAVPGATWAEAAESRAAEVPSAVVPAAPDAVFMEALSDDGVSVGGASQIGEAVHTIESEPNLGLPLVVDLSSNSLDTATLRSLTDASDGISYGFAVPQDQLLHGEELDVLAFIEGDEEVDASRLSGEAAADERADLLPPEHARQRKQSNAALRELEPSYESKNQPDTEAGQTLAEGDAGRDRELQSQAQLRRQQVYLPQQVAVFIGRAVERGQVGPAKQTAQVLAKRTGGQFPLALQMRDVLQNEALPLEEQRRQIIDLAAQAEHQLIDMARDAELRRRLSPELYAIARPAPVERAFENATSDAAEPEPLLLAILVADTSDSALQLLKDAGLSVEGVSHDTHVVVGRLAPSKLADLALLHIVRRVEFADVR